MKQEKYSRGRGFFFLLLMLVALFFLFFVAINQGSLEVSMSQLYRGLFVAYDPQVATVYDLRFPRVLISMVAGAGLGVSGVLLQAVLRNPLADPGIIGVSGGASFFVVVASTFFPSLYNWNSLFAVLGGCFAFFLVYSLSFKAGLSPIVILLTGIAIQAFFSGLSEGLSAMNGGSLTGVASIVNGNISMKNWSDVAMLSYTTAPVLFFSFFLAHRCDILSLEDKTAQGVGINVGKTRLLLSFVAVLLASFATSVVGMISFLGLLVPNLARLMVGSRHGILIPFSAVLGALVFLATDTLGRTMAHPYEISAAILMSVIGGPMFILFVQRSGMIHGK